MTGCSTPNQFETPTRAFIMANQYSNQGIETLEERFWTNVDRRGIDECWPWLGSKFGKGYGRIRIGDKLRPAHRVSWEIANGAQMADGLYACHHCDNPPCVNPAHIFAGTPSENAIDMMSKGRNPIQKGSPNLNEAIAKIIKSRLAAGQSQRSLALEFRISTNTIHKIFVGKIWSHV